MFVNKYFLEESEKMDFMEENPGFKLPFSPLTFPDHEEFAERIRKSLYYGKLPKDDRPSLPMTDIAVDFLRERAPRELGKIDMYWASDVSRRAFISPCSLMLGMIYIERLKHKNPDYLNTVSSSDLFLISMMVASKYLYDEGIEEEVYNDEWAESADMDVEDVNTLEREFLHAIDWSLFTKKEDFEKLLGRMEERIAVTQGIDRGGFWSYTDLLILLTNARLNGTLREVMGEICRVVLVCSVAYTAGTVTVLGSVSTLNLLKAHIHLHSGQHTAMVMIQNRPSLTSGDIPGIDISIAKSSSVNKVDNIGVREDSEQHKKLMYQDHYSSNSSTTTVSTESAVSDNDKGRRNRGLSLSGLLTLAFIKDTVTQFLNSANSADSTEADDVQGNENNTRSMDDSRKKHTTPTCSCPKCPMKIKSRRQKWLRSEDNSSSCISHIIIPPYGLWGSLRYGYKCCGGKKGSTSHNVGKSTGSKVSGTGRGTVSISSDGDEVKATENDGIRGIDIYKMLNLPFVNYPSCSSKSQVEDDCALKGNDFHSDVPIPKCQARERNLNYLMAGLGNELERSVFDLASRFGTSAQVALAG